MNSAIFVARFSLVESDSAATKFVYDHVITYITNRGRLTSDFSGNLVIILYTIFSYLPQNLSGTTKCLHWRLLSCKERDIWFPADLTKHAIPKFVRRRLRKRERPVEVRLQFLPLKEQRKDIFIARISKGNNSYLSIMRITRKTIRHCMDLGEHHPCSS